MSDVAAHESAMPSAACRTAVEIHERTCRPWLRAEYLLGAHVAVKDAMDRPATARLTPDLVHAGR
jgi:hypothetical protein